MPVYLRTFYFGKLSETKKKENQEMEKAQKQSKPTGISKPGIPRR